jgi:hypothetical protein
MIPSVAACFANLTIISSWFENIHRATDPLDRRVVEQMLVGAVTLQYARS